MADPLATDIKPSAASQKVRAAIEAVVLAIICLAPWAYGGVMPGAEFLLQCGVALALLLWAVRMLIQWRAHWSHCPLILCLSALFLLGIAQLISMPSALMHWISPGTAQLYDVVLPAAEEILPFGQPREPVSPSAGSTLSLYPAATRQELIRLLGVLLLYVLIRNNLTTTNSLRRLCLAATINGALLAVFGYVQFFTSPHNMLYWVHSSPGAVFGPFVNRNHFAFYINLCLGLSLGLYLSKAYRSDSAGKNVSHQRAGRRPSRFDWLQHPGRLWLNLPLALMFSSVAFSLSRGGLIALGIALVLWLLIAAHRSDRLLQRAAPVAAVACGLALLAWFGFDRIERRFAQTWSAGTNEARLQVWTSGIQLLQDFPLFGTGFGTFAEVEPLHRPLGADWRLTATHADNDYLEALVEGGVLRLLLSVIAIGIVLKFGYRATLMTRDREAAALALGALLGFTTLVLHSFVDFGLHIPAIAMLATVIAAHLCTLGRSPENESLRDSAKKPVESTTGQFAGLTPVVGAGLAIFSAVILCKAGWANNQAEELRFAASRTSADDLPEKINQLSSAVELSPDDARLQLDLAIAHLDAYQRTLDAANTPAELPEMTPEALELLKRFGLDTLGQEPPAPRDDETQTPANPHDARARFDHLLPALRHLLLARDCCPVMASTNMWIASNAARFDSTDPQMLYLERAKLLAPADADLWYACGLQEILQTQEPFRAWDSWRHSLELSGVHLADILDRSAGFLDPPQMIEVLLPDRPAILLQAANHLYPDPENPKERRPLDKQARQMFVEQALALLQDQPGRLSPADIHLQAQLLAATDNPAEAIESYRMALLREPRQVDWRLELAQLLRSQHRYEEAQREVNTILGMLPSFHQARALAQTLAGEIASGKTGPASAPAGSKSTDSSAVGP